MEMFATSEFWIAVAQIIMIDILLGGDNAVVIALAARSLPPEQQRKAVLIGSGAAVVLRIVLTIVAAKLLALPYLQIIGGLLLLWIGLQLLGEEDEGEGHHRGDGAAATGDDLGEQVIDLTQGVEHGDALAQRPRRVIRGFLVEGLHRFRASPGASRD